METLDLTAYRPKDTWDLLEAWRKEGLYGVHRTQPYLVHLQIANVTAPTDPNGVVYNAFATVDFHFKRSDKAKVHDFRLVVGYHVSERNFSYSLKMRAQTWGSLDAVPIDFPDIFPYRGEGVYDELCYAYAGFWRAVLRPFLGVRHEDLHGDNPDLAFAVSA
jgi:hypothetical protein